VNQRGRFFNSRQSFFFDGTLVFEQAERTSLGAQWFSVEHSQAEPDLRARTTLVANLWMRPGCAGADLLHAGRRLRIAV